MKMKIVQFYQQLQEGQLFGYKIMTVKQANLFMKSVKLLQQNQSVFSVGSNQYLWNIQLFQVRGITASQIKTLGSIFNIYMQDDQSRSVGIFPDAIQQAYQQGLTGQNQQIGYQQDF